MTRPMLATDPGLAELPMVSDAATANRTAGLPTAVFADIKGNPVGKNVDDGVAATARRAATGSSPSAAVARSTPPRPSP